MPEKEVNEVKKGFCFLIDTSQFLNSIFIYDPIIANQSIHYGWEHPIEVEPPKETIPKEDRQ